jgi:hypothetical protein
LITLGCGSEIPAGCKGSGVQGHAEIYGSSGLLAGAAVWHTSSAWIVTAADPAQGCKAAAGDRTVSASAINTKLDTSRMSYNNIKSQAMST